MKYIFCVLITWSLVLMSCSRGADRGEAELLRESTSLATAQSAAMENGILKETGKLKVPAKEADDLVHESIRKMEDARQIVKKADLVHEVKSNSGYNNYVRSLLGKYHAYIFKEDNSAVNNSVQTTMIIKVPVNLFDSLIAELAIKDVKQLQKNISSEDITGEVVDTRARLETRKVTRGKYLEFLNKAAKIEDVLKIQQEINNIQEDIESAEALLVQLSGQARYSTINLTYFEPDSGNENYGMNPGFWGRTGKAIKNGATMLGEIFIAFITAWPVWIIIILIILIVKRNRRRWKFERKQ